MPAGFNGCSLLLTFPILGPKQNGNLIPQGVPPVMSNHHPPHLLPNLQTSALTWRETDLWRKTGTRFMKAATSIASARRYGTTLPRRAA
jgi:hypothetical protein